MQMEAPLVGILGSRQSPMTTPSQSVSASKSCPFQGSPSPDSAGWRRMAEPSGPERGHSASQYSRSSGPGGRHAMTPSLFNLFCMCYCFLLLILQTLIPNEHLILQTLRVFFQRTHLAKMSSIEADIVNTEKLRQHFRLENIIWICI